MKRILIIEDNLVHSRLMENQLRSRYELIFAFDSETALAYLNGNHASYFDLVVLDSLMPKRPGESPSSEEAIRIIRESGRDVPLVVVSGSPTEHLKREFERLCVMRIFAKPFSLTEFTKFVDDVLDPDADV